MDRRKFFKMAGTCTGGMLLLPDFLYSFAMQEQFSIGENSLVFIQLNGGNDGLNTFVPYENDLYYHYRPAIALSRNEVIPVAGGMGLHPALKKLAQIQQNGHLSIIQNVGYPNPNRSHFRSQEIWHTATASNEYADEGWLGRYLDHHYHAPHPAGAVNIDNIDTLALRGHETNSVTLKSPAGKFTETEVPENKLSGNPQLDFVKRLAGSSQIGTLEIQKAYAKSSDAGPYPKTGLGNKLKWISRLIKGDLNSKVYYTSLNGFDTHAAQLSTQNNKFTELGDAVFSFYDDMKSSGRLENTTVVIFSEFGRRVKDNGKGTDHGTAAPMFIIGGKNKGRIIGKNPDLQNLDKGDLIHEIDFRSVYASLLNSKLSFDPKLIGLKNEPLAGLF